MDEQAQQEMYRLAKENNRMLHAMRRNAFWGGLFKFVFWTAILVAPIWFYMAYLNTTVDKMLHAIDQVQGTGAKAQSQFNGIEASWKEFEARFGFGSSSTTSQQ